MKTRTVQASLSTLLLLLLIVAMVMALGGGINGRFTIGSGGGQVQSSGVHLTSTIGQPIGGIVSSGVEDVVLCSGLICGAVVPPKPPDNPQHLIFLPTIQK